MAQAWASHWQSKLQPLPNAELHIKCAHRCSSGGVLVVQLRWSQALVGAVGQCPTEVVCVHKNGSLTASDSLYDFIFLETVLSLAFAGLILVAIMASLVQFNEHKLLAQVVVKAQSQSQLAVAQVLTD